jgi:transposase
MHAVIGKHGRPIAFRLTARGTDDAPLDEELLEEFRPGDVGSSIADAAYDSDAIRQRGQRLKAKVCIKPHPTRKDSAHLKRSPFSVAALDRRNRKFTVDLVSSETEASCS